MKEKMAYRVGIADNADDLFSDEPYVSFISFDFESEEEAMKFAKMMVEYGKSTAILIIK